MKKEKCVEYFFDSKEYNKTQVIENMKKEQGEFEKRKAKVEIYLNEYGIYVAQLKFLNNQLSIVNNKMITKIIDKKKKRQKLKIRKTFKGYETYQDNGRTYGNYKKTKKYEPI